MKAVVVLTDNIGQPGTTFESGTEVEMEFSYSGTNAAPQFVAGDEPALVEYTSVSDLNFVTADPTIVGKVTYAGRRDDIVIDFEVADAESPGGMRRIGTTIADAEGNFSFTPGRASVQRSDHDLRHAAQVRSGRGDVP